jgi:hypothetical protein
MTTTQMTNMKPTRLFPRINFTFLALAVALAGTLLFAGCATTGDSGSEMRDSDSSGHQHHH